MGIAFGSPDYQHIDDILRNADTAMYQAKGKGRARFEIFDKDMHTRVVKTLQMEANLRRAVERKEFELLYQPVISVKTGKIEGCEALLRWNHPKMGIISPKEFIPIAEETGLITQIDQWSLHAACIQNKLWQDAHKKKIKITVNLSTYQLKQKKLPETVSKVLEITKLDPKHLQIELTENIVIENSELAIDTLEELRSMGISLSVDDFGTGYSSLTYLKRFSLDTLKLDQSFVIDVTKDSDSAAIAKTIVSLAHILNMEVVAEGVETEAQLKFLKEIGCDKIQGFVFYSPLTTLEMNELLDLDPKHSI
jgi:EAL domain-containing protein (putative c-di-GMP-specific phosphodiesterase class I)